MPHRTFIAFILPSALAMLIFIALPIVSVVVQSLYIEHERVVVTAENCGPFGCKKESHVDEAATAALRQAEPLGRFNGLGTYLDRNHLAAAQIADAYAAASGFFDFVSASPLYHSIRRWASRWPIRWS